MCIVSDGLPNEERSIETHAGVCSLVSLGGKTFAASSNVRHGKKYARTPLPLTKADALFAGATGSYFVMRFGLMTMGIMYRNLNRLSLCAGRVTERNILEAQNY
jgi:hypothetical protein